MADRDEREIKKEIEKLWVNATIQELECIEDYVSYILRWSWFRMITTCCGIMIFVHLDCPFCEVVE